MERTQDDRVNHPAMEHTHKHNVNYLVVGHGILKNVIDTVGVAGRGDVDGGRQVSSRAEDRAWAELEPRIHSGELRDQQMIWEEARAALDRALQGNDAEGELVGVAAALLPDTGEDIPLSARDTRGQED